jgi:hypothetical protein
MYLMVFYSGVYAPSTLPKCIHNMGTTLLVHCYTLWERGIVEDSVLRHSVLHFARIYANVGNNIGR